MRRGATGEYERTTVSEETVEAFIPAPLPPEPPIEFGAELQALLEAATLALGRLDGISGQLPDAPFFLYPYVRKEAVLSSQIEGTQSSLSDLMMYELEGTPGVPLDDVVEVCNYVAALQHGVERMRGGFPISSRLIREIHALLLRSGRGATKDPGRFRRSQNWLGGTRPGTAVFVPPPHRLVPACMTDLERFIHRRGDGLATLVRAGLTHVQFETIHPFLDGNGRVGRILITLMLCDGGLLDAPLLYLSLFFKEHRSRYYELLGRVRETGDWEAWLAFFLEGVRDTAQGALAAERRLAKTSARHRQQLETVGRKAGSARRVLEAFGSRPLLTIGKAAELTGLSFPTASSAMDVLQELSIVREITGRQRDRIYAYDDFIDILNEGTEPL